MLVLPKLISPVSPRVVLIRPGKYDPDQYSILEIIAVTNVIQKVGNHRGHQFGVVRLMRRALLENTAKVKYNHCLSCL